MAGFDFTKIANNGSELPSTSSPGSGATDWACTRDNITGLTWEVKTTSTSDARYFGHRYTWYNANAAENGGHSGGVGSSSTCFPAMSQCNTQAFADAVNRSALCGYADWRLPTPRELRSIVSYGDVDTAVSVHERIGVDRNFFPNMPLERAYWSSYSYAPDPALGWVVEIGRFDGGGAGHGHSKAGGDSHSTGDEHTILVRGPQVLTSSGPCPAGNPRMNVAVVSPTADFMEHGDGTVTHVSTGLMWKRCAEGLSGETCANGEAMTMFWDVALAAAESSGFAGYSDWRVPNFKELHSIVESCGYDPAINQTVFPRTPRPPFGSVFWTSTSWAPAPSDAWVVVFDRGGGVATPKGSRLFVRLVRGGASSAAYDAQVPPRQKSRAVRH